jgi:hypothetical protein
LLSQDQPSETFLDDLQKIIKIRRSFETESENKKPALFSYSKNSDENSIYTADVAVLYKNRHFSTDVLQFTPVLQFNYSSDPNNLSQRISGDLNAYWIFYESSGSASIHLQPTLSLLRDFVVQSSQFRWNVVAVPKLPDQHIYNVTELEYNQSEEVWNQLLYGFIPIIGIGGDHEINRNETQNDELRSFRGILKGQFNIRTYYAELDLALNCENEFANQKRTFFDYSAGVSLYFDVKQRASLNAVVERIQYPEVARNTHLQIGFGIKL